MKYQSLPSFEKHLQEAFPAFLAPVYMVLHVQDFERKKIAAKLIALFQKKDPACTPHFFQVSEVEIEKVLGELSSTSLWGGASLVILEGVEKLKKPALEKLGAYVQNPTPRTHLILCGNTCKGVTDLYLKGKKEVVLIDLSDEKPWERQERLKQYLIVQAQAAGKTLSAEALAYLLKEAGHDMAFLEQELFKLLCYSGERAHISLQDAQTLTPAHNKATGWQVAESLIWGEGSVALPAEGDLSMLIALVGQVRYHLQLGCQMATDLSAARAQFPHLKPQLFEKYQQVVKKRGPFFFQEGLLALYTLELSCKSSDFSPALLWGRFTAKLHTLAQR